MSAFVPNMDAEVAPITQPPLGETANPMHPEDLAPYNVLCQAVCLSLATIAVTLRMLTTVKITKKWRLDDCTQGGILGQHDANGG